MVADAADTANADLPEEYETSIRVIVFKGEREKWRQWKIKTKAIGMKKKWVEALETDQDIKGVIVTDEGKKKKKQNSDAWNYLVMACEAEPFDIITSETETSAFIAWSKLKEEYEPTTDEALIEVQEEFVRCKMLSKKDDPALWIDKLKVINKRLAGIDKKYEKGDIEMYSYIMANLPQEYSAVVTVLKAQGIGGKTLSVLRTSVRDVWKRDIEDKAEAKSNEQSLNTDGKKKFSGSKKFKGMCGFCGKQGHKKEHCFKKKQEDKEKGGGDETNNSEEKKKVKNPNIICFRCKKKGHPAFMCPDKDKETGMMAFNFNVEEVNDDEQKQDIWWCEDATDETGWSVTEPEWHKVDISEGYSRFMLVEKEDRPVVSNSNQYGVLYESDDDDSSVDTKGTFGDGDEYEDEDMDFIIPSCYSYGTESVYKY
jgi:hypothetical protein